jgi:hypothetical protein
MSASEHAISESQESDNGNDGRDDQNDCSHVDQLSHRNVRRAITTIAMLAWVKYHYTRRAGSAR